MTSRLILGSIFCAVASACSNSAQPSAAASSTSQPVPAVSSKAGTGASSGAGALAAMTSGGSGGNTTPTSSASPPQAGRSAASGGQPAVPPATGGSSGAGSGGQGTAGAAAGATAAAGSGAIPASGDCAGANSLPLPDDPGVRGPWEVGVRTITLGRLTVEVTYPAEPGSTAGKPEATYNLVTFLPKQEQSKIPADHSPDVGPVGGHLYRDVPLDAQHGPYPVIVFIHGTASMRIASGSAATHWASRGNVVLSADYPGLGLLDQLNAACGYPVTGEQDIPGDVKTQLDALKQEGGALQFLAGHTDLKRLALGGHSQGACLTAQLADLENVQLILPLTGSTPVTQPAPNLKSIMWIAGMDDTVIGYDSLLIGNTVCPATTGLSISNVDAYKSAPGAPNVKKRLVGIKGGGHLSVTDLCQTNKQGRNAVQEAQEDKVCGVESAVIIGLPALNDCGPGSLPWQKGVEIVNYVSAAAIDETLHCKNRDAAFMQAQMRFPEIGDFRHEP